MPHAGGPDRLFAPGTAAGGGFSRRNRDAVLDRRAMMGGLRASPELDEDEDGAFVWFEEGGEFRRGAGPEGEPPYDFGWLWKELGLAEERR